MIKRSLNDYQAIINMQRHISKLHKRMTNYERSAQFAPFAALKGFDESIMEASRLTIEKKELSEEEVELINQRILQLIGLEKKDIAVNIEYFIKDKTKKGGSIINKEGIFKKFDDSCNEIVLQDKTRINLDNIYSIEIIN